MGIVSINGLNADFAIAHKTGAQDNSVYEILNREGFRLCVHGVSITGNNNTYTTNVFKVTGAVRVIDQYAIITEATSIANCTNVYSTLYDGTNTVNLTADGATLSAAPIGTLFLKDQDVSQPYSVVMSDQCRVNEITLDKRAGKPFTINAKYGADTYVRFHYKTTGVLNFKMDIHFIYQKLDGGDLVLA